MIIRNIICGITVLSGMFLILNCSKQPEINSMNFSGIGTVLQVIYTGQKDAEMEELLKKDIVTVESELSYFKPDSYISQINTRGFEKEIAVPHHVCTLIERSIQFGHDSEGVFDITYKSEGVLWEKNKDREPTEEEIAEAKKSTGLDKVTVDCTKNTVKTAVKGILLDLGGIAKGYAIDRAGAILRSKGHPDFIVNYGGDMLICGRKGEKPWTVGVKDPDNGNDFLKKLEFGTGECRGVATSGDYERFLVINGNQYSHIFDPRTGRPVKNARSVTVVGKDGELTDAVATAVSVAHDEEQLIKKIMEKFNVKIYTLTGSDKLWKEW